MNAEILREHILSRAPWVNLKRTVDTVKIGDPYRAVTRIGVGWMASMENLRSAYRDGCELFVSHEPTFNDHLEPTDGECRTVEPGLSKRKWLEETGMVVLRCHDAWDGWPVIGIRDSWARGLGLTDFVAQNTEPGKERGWHAVYRIEPTTLGSFARYVAGRTAALGQDGVEVIGDPEMPVRHPALGVGCGGPDTDMISCGADVLICCYDGDLYWRDRERFAELGVGVIMVEHGTTEMWGIESLARWLASELPTVNVTYYDLHPRSWHVSA